MYVSLEGRSKKKGWGLVALEHHRAPFWLAYVLLFRETQGVGAVEREVEKIAKATVYISQIFDLTDELPVFKSYLAAA